MDLYIVSASQNPLVTKPLLDQIAEAIEFQLYQHVAPFWQGSGVRVVAVSSMEGVPQQDGASPLIVYDTPQQAGFLGWHTFNSQTGQVNGQVFVQPIVDNGGTMIQGPNSLSSVLSHESIEAVLDPYVNLWAWKDANTMEPVEGCDRVQGDSYQVNGVSLSNFLGPRAFRNGPGPYDWLRKLGNPWDLTPGGYAAQFDLTTHQWNNIYGAQVPQWKRDLHEQKIALKLSRLGQRLAAQAPPAPSAAPPPSSMPKVEFIP